MARLRSRFGILAYGIVLAGVALLCVFVGLVALYAVAPPVSTLMLGRTLEGKSYQRIYVRLKNIAPAAVAAVIASEDARFCENDGVEWGALSEVLNEADEGGPRRGASTITMQTAKNLFLWPGRSAIRKGVEIGMALALGKVLSEGAHHRSLPEHRRIGRRVVRDRGCGASLLPKRSKSARCARGALLATSLPNPIKRDPGVGSSARRKRRPGIERRGFDKTEMS